MQLFLAKLDRSLREEEIHSYFSKYGSIRDLRIKDGYGFLTFQNNNDALKALAMRKQCIGDYEVVVEESNGKRNHSDFDNRNDDNDRRRMMTGGYPNDHGYNDRRYDGYNDRRNDSNFNDRRGGGFNERGGSYNDRDNFRDRDSYYMRPRGFDNFDRLPSRRCDYCDRCPVHGTLRGDRFEGGSFNDYRHERREHFSDKFKIVLEGIPENTETEDLNQFCMENELTPNFVRISRNKKFGIIELKSIEEKEEALIKLEGKKLKECTVSVREFKSGPPSRDDFREKRFRSFPENNSGNEKKDDVYGDIPSERKEDKMDL